MTVSKAVAAVRWTAAANLIKTLVAACQLVIISRSLEPVDFATVILCSTVISLFLSLTDVGLSSALFRFRDVSDSELSSLYWLTLAVGGATAVIVCLLSPFTSSFYNNGDLLYLIIASSPIFLLNSAALQFRVIGERDLDFSRVSSIEIFSYGVGFCGFLVAIAWGFPIYSVVIGQTINQMSVFLLYLSFPSAKWRPNFYFRYAALKKFLSFGADMTILNWLTMITVQLDMLISGAILSKYNLAVFSQPRDLSFRIMTAVNPIITRVTLPLISQNQGNVTRIGEIYARTITMSCSVTFPLFGFIALNAADIVSVFFGDKWRDSGEILPAICVWFMVRSVINPLGSLMTALGATKKAIKYQSLYLVLNAFSVTISAMYSVYSIPFALAITNLFLVELSYFKVVRPLCSMSALIYHMCLLRPLLCSVFAFSIGLIIAYQTQTTGLLKILLTGACGLSSYLLISMLINKPWIMDMKKLISGRKA